MKCRWEAWMEPEGSIMIKFKNGTRIEVKNDGKTGYEFVLSYLEHMSKHYKNHLHAMDGLLRQRYGKDYINLSKVPKVYNANLAVASICCLFGEQDAILDCDERGEMHFEFMRCPCRCQCKYNGYAQDGKRNPIAGCNPIYEVNLTAKQLEVADLLVNTGYTYSDIGLMLGVSETMIAHHAANIYARLGVANRAELKDELKNKRLI